MIAKQLKSSSSASPVVSTGLVVGLLFCILFISLPAVAREWRVEAGNGTLQSAIDAAQAGDSLLLAAGTYTGSVNIHRRLILSGNGVNGNAGDSIIDGEDSSHVIRVAAPDVVIRGLNIQHSGTVAEDEDSGIFITDKGDRTRIEDNYLENNLIGVYLKGPESAVVRNNVIIADVLPFLPQPVIGVPDERVEKEQRFDKTLKDIDHAIAAFDVGNAHPNRVGRVSR